MKLDVVMPVYNQSRFTAEILGYIRGCPVLPNRIIIINNASTDDTGAILRRFRDLPLLVLEQPENIGVNASWNLGLHVSDAEVVAVLNNDLIIGKNFFKLIADTFKNPKIGYAVPMTVNDQKAPLNNHTSTTRLAPLGNREGWAFSIRRMIFLKAGPIPSSLFTFFGDDYLFKAVQDQKFQAVKMVDNLIYHYLSQTLYTTTLGAEKLPDDSDGWRKFMDPTARVEAKQQPALPQNKKSAKEAWESLPMAVDMACYAPWYQEIIKKICAARGLKKRVRVVECGSRFGCSARIMLDAFPDGQNFKLVCIDPELKPHLSEIVDNVRVEYWDHECEACAKEFKDGTIDVLHIDTDPHEYEQTKKQLDLYAAKVRKGGCVILHDATPKFGVDKLVKELETDTNWTVERAEPHPNCPISAPAVAWKV